MPDQTTIDYSTFSADQLRYELAALYEDLDEARTRVAQIEHDIARAEEALAKL